MSQAIPLRSVRSMSQFDPVVDAKGRKATGLFRYRPTGVIYVRKTFRSLGIPDLFRTTGETGIGAARTAAEVMIQRWKNKHLGIDDGHVFGKAKIDDEKTVRAAIKWVLENVTPTVRPSTQWKHKYFLGLIEEEFGALALDSITVEDFNRWVMRLRQRKFGPNVKKGKPGYRPPAQRKSFEDFSKYMNLLYRTAYKRKATTHLLVFPNPDRNLIASRKERARRFTDAELASIWAELDDDMRDQFVLAAECYMRLREALKLTWDRLDLKTGKVTLRPIDVKTGSKTGRGREFILSPMALERMRERKKRIGLSSRFVFPGRNDPNRPQQGNRKAWVSAKKRAGISGPAKWHDLRHTALSRALLDKGANPTKVSQYAGVSIPTIERTYLHASAEDTAEAGLAARLPLKECEGADKNCSSESKYVEKKGKKG